MNGLDSLYQNLILEAAKRRSGEGELAEFDAEHFEKNPSCGDEVTLRVRLEGERIAQIGWLGDGCSISMASTSIMVEQLQGQPVARALDGVRVMREMLRARGHAELSEDDEELIGDAVALEGVGRYVMRVKCAMLGWVALEAAVREASTQ